MGPESTPCASQHSQGGDWTLMLGVHVGPFCPGRQWFGTLERVSRGGRYHVGPVPAAGLGRSAGMKGPSGNWVLG